MSVNVPLANKGRLITRLMECLGHRNGFAIQADIVDKYAMCERIASGKQAGAKRRADRAGGNGRGEDNALAGQAIEVRRSRIGVPGIPQRLGPPLVGDENNDVRPIGRLERAGEEEREKNRQSSDDIHERFQQGGCRSYSSSLRAGRMACKNFSIVGQRRDGSGSRHK